MAIRTTGVVPEGTPFLLLPFGRRYPAFQLRERYVDLISHDRRISSRASHAGRGRDSADSGNRYVREFHSYGDRWR
jgi:hypothetical protein